MGDQRKCSMCRNHFGAKAPCVKNHKCEFRNPYHIEKCEKGCKKVEDRRKKVAEDKKQIYKIEKLQNCVAKRISPSNNMMSSVTSVEKISKNERKCRKCMIHGLSSPLKKGHLKSCPLINCPCARCKMIDARRMASNNFTKHYRVQRIEEQKCSQPLSPQDSPESGYASEHDNYSPKVEFSSVSECSTLPEYYSTFKSTCHQINQTSYMAFSSEEAMNFNALPEQHMFNNDDATQIVSEIISNFSLETVENLEKNVFESEVTFISFFFKFIKLCFMFLGKIQ